MGFSALNIGATALITASAQISTSGNNTANANTEGYSRQSVAASSRSVSTSVSFSTGNGVSISAITRTVDTYYQKLERTANNSCSFYDNLESTYSTLESYIGELSDNDISTLLDDFWSSLSDVSGDVTDDALRQAVVTSASILSTGMNSIDDDMISMQMDLNSQIKQSVSSINGLTSQIATLNEQIGAAEAGGATANSLRDTRDSLIYELNSYLDITVQIDAQTGTYNIYNGNNVLVYRDSSEELTTEVEFRENLPYYMPVFANGGMDIDTNSGTLGAQLDMRDEIIPSYQAELDTLAANVIWKVNQITSQGSGLTGFTDLTGTTKVEDPSVALNKLVYDFAPVKGTYEIVDGSFEVVVHNTDTDEEKILVMDVDLDGVGADTMLYDEDNPTAANSLINQMQNALEADYPGAFTVTLNEDNQVVITANSELYSMGFGRDSSGALAALGINTLFSGSDASSIEVNEVVANNTDLLATGDSLNETGNETVQSLLELRNATVMSGGKDTLEGYYQSIIVRLGNASSSAHATYEYKVDVLKQAKEQSETVSGVSLDEEATKLIAYQSAYQGAANFISIVNSCYQSLLDMV